MAASSTSAQGTLLRLGPARPRRGWAALAAETGFSDQAHLCREFRRHLGLRPGELRRRLQDESAWVYRIWS